MNEEQWKAYSVAMAGLQNQSQAMMNQATIMAANAATNCPYWLRYSANALQNVCAPRCITDRVWNEDTW